MSRELVLTLGVLCCVAAPLVLFLVLAASGLFGRPLAEPATARAARGAMLVSALGSLIAIAAFVSLGARVQVLDFGTWFSSGHGAFAMRLLVDPLSLAFSGLATTLCGVVAAFSGRYLQREPGHLRYFMLFAAFAGGMQLIALAGSMEVLFAGWELVGLSSALLVAFFHTRSAPVQNGLWVFAVYRLSDAAMLAAAVAVHHHVGSGDLSLLFSAGDSAAIVSPQLATLVAALLLLSVACKSALLPFSGWLPRAMEGPTPSSAVYYGALSVHAGCYLLIRAAPLLEQAPLVRIAAAVLGAVTALYATLVARVQADVKSSLAFAALSQVGLIVLEIALGLYTLAFVHLVGHACFRMLQLLSAPDALRGHEQLSAVHAETGRQYAALPAGARRWLYAFALERGFLDAALQRWVVRPFRRVTGALNTVDRWLVGGRSPAARAAKPPEPRK